MRFMKLPAALLVAALTALGAASPLAAQQAAVLAEGGTVYRVLRGTCAALRACPAGAGETNVALALERETSGGTLERLLVPGTDGEAIESNPALAIDRSTDRVFVVWDRMETIHSTLRLASFARDGWSEVVEIAGDAFSFKRNPQMAVTRDEYPRVAADGSVAVEKRLVLHVVWWDEAGIGSRPLYTALVVEDGQLLPNWSILSLLEFLPEQVATTELPVALFRTPQVRTVGSGSRALIAFGDPIGGRLATVEVDVVGGNVVSFADEARAQVIIVGRNNPTFSRAQVAEAARPGVTALARNLFDGAVAEFLAEQFLRDVVTSGSNGDLQNATAEARAQVIIVGRRLREGLQIATAEARAQVIIVGRRALADPDSDTGHLVRVRMASAWPAPWVPERTIRLLTSSDGRDIALAWDADAAVKYRQLQGGGWSEIRALAIGPQLDRDAAYALIEQRLAQR
jgi:hypothetical protein